MSDADPSAGLRALAAASLFPTEGELAVDGLREPVSVRRDAWGAPYIEAASLDDLWFAQGMITAGERLFQLDLALRAATGRLSEIFGERTLDSDRFVRTVGFHRAGTRLAQRWTTTPRHARAVPRRGRGMDRRDAVASGRVHDARRAPRDPRRRRSVGRRVRVPVLGTVG